MSARRLGVLLCTAAVALLLAAFVWPTRYRDITLRSGGPSILAARQQRFTGRVDVLTREGWRPLVAPDSAGADPLAGYTPDWRASPRP